MPITFCLYLAGPDGTKANYSPGRIKLSADTAKSFVNYVIFQRSDWLGRVCLRWCVCHNCGHGLTQDGA